MENHKKHWAEKDMEAGENGYIEGRDRGMPWCSGLRS